MKSDLLQLSKPSFAGRADGFSFRKAKHPRQVGATPIWKEIIPAVLAGSEVHTQSETGSGKTLTFAKPIIEQLNRRDGLRVLSDHQFTRLKTRRRRNYRGTREFFLDNTKQFSYLIPID